MEVNIKDNNGEKYIKLIGDLDGVSSNWCDRKSFKGSRGK